MDSFFVYILCLLVWWVIGVTFAKIYYRRRHGVVLSLRGGMDTAFKPAYWLSMVWPLFLFVPSLKDPEPCRHIEHIEARERAAARERDAEEAYDRQRKRGTEAE